jgi:hypothetical protein
LSLAAIYLKYEAYPRPWQGLIVSVQQSAVSKNKDLSNQLDNDWFPGIKQLIVLIYKADR